MISGKRILFALAVAMPTAGGAFAGETADTAIASCLQELNLPGSVCTCIGERAETELSASEQEFFIAMITRNQTAADSMRGGMTVNEMTKVAMFMNSAPQQCAGQ